MAPFLSPKKGSSVPGTRYRYKGRFVSEARARHYSTLRNAKKHVSTEATHQRRTIARITKFRTPRGMKPVIEKAQADRRLERLEREREEQAAKIERLEARRVEEISFEEELSETEFFGLEPLMDEAEYIDEFIEDMADVDEFDDNYFGEAE